MDSNKKFDGKCICTGTGFSKKVVKKKGKDKRNLKNFEKKRRKNGKKGFFRGKKCGIKMNLIKNIIET